MPTASLVLSTDAIGEAGGSASVTATLDGRSVQEITLRVTVAAVEPAGDRAFRQQGTMLTIPAGATASTDTVTVTAVDNDEDAPDVTVTISAEVAAGHASAPPAGTLTIADDDARPRVRLQLSPASIGEAAGSSTVTASLSRPSSEATTVEVAVEPADNATAGDFSLSANLVLTIAAGARDSAGTVTVTAVNDDIFRPNRTLTVTGTAANSRGVTGPVARTLTIEEDEATPIITLALSADAIDEAGGTATVSATLGGALDRAVTVTVSAAPKPIAFVGQVDIGANRELTFVAGQVSSTGTVTITAVDNDIDAADTAIRVTAVVGGGELTAPAPVELTVRDDEDAPSVSLERSPATIAEDGGEATVVTALTHPSSADTIVQVTAQPVAPAQPRDFEQTGTQLAILAGETVGVWTVTIAAVDNDVDAPDRTVTVTGTAANAYGLSGQPEAVTIDIVDDEAEPTAHLILNPPSVTERSGSSTVTARLSHPSGEPTTVTVTVSPGAHTDADDFSVSTNRMLTIAADEHASTGTVTITAVDDDSYGPDGSVTVSATAVNSHGVGDLADRGLTIEEDDPRPAASLVLSAAAIEEDGGAAAITVQIDRMADVALTYTVRAAPVAPATGAHFSVAGEPVLTISVGATESSGTVTLTATSNDVDEPDRTVRVTAAPNAAAGLPVAGLSVPQPRTLTIRDDDQAPAVTLALSQSEIGERDEAATVTATLDHPSSAVTTVRIQVDPVAPAEHRDFRQIGSLLTIPAAATASTGSVSVRAVDNDADAPDRTVNISGVANNRHGIAGNPDAVTLTIRDDDEHGICDRGEIVRRAILSALSENAEVTGCSDVTDEHLASIVELRPTPTADASLLADDLAGLFNMRTFDASDADLASVPPGFFAALHSVQKIDLSSNPLASLPAGVFAGLRALSEVDLRSTSVTRLPDAAFARASALSTLRLANASLSVFLVTAGPGQFRAYMPTAAPFDVTVPFTVSNATVRAAEDPSRTVMIRQGRTHSGRLEITASGQDPVTVSMGALPATPRLHSGYRLARGNSTPATPLVPFVAITEGTTLVGSAPQVVVQLSNPTISEAGGSTTVTARLLQPWPGEDIVLAVRGIALSGPAVGFRLSDNTRLTIAAGTTASTGAVTITAVDDDDYSGAASEVEVSADVVAGTATVPGYVVLTIEEDEAPPLSLHVTPETIVEGGSAQVSVAIASAWEEDVSVYVRVEPVAPARLADFALFRNASAIQLLKTAEVEFRILRGYTASSRILTVRTEDDDAYVVGRTLRVSARTNSNELPPPPAVTLTIQEDQADRDRARAAGICLRTPAVQTALLSAIADVDDCALVTAQQLAGIAELALVGGSLNSLRSGDFQGLDGLRELTISGTQLRRVPPRAFLGLANLERLVLQNNHSLQPPEDGGFAGMPKLTTLRITGPTVLSGGTSTTNFHRLRPDMFADLPELTELDLSGSAVFYLPARAFAGLSKLQRLDVSWNGPIRELSPHAFAGLSSLRYLNMSYMKGLAGPDRGNLPEGIFNGLISLSDLNIDNAWENDSNLPRGLFEGLPKLRYVRLAGANRHTLDSFPARTFVGLTAPLALLEVVGKTVGDGQHTAYLQVGLQAVGFGKFRAVAPSGAPFDIELPLTVTGGSVVGGASSVTIRAGAIDSEILQAIRSQDSAAPITVDIGELPSVPASSLGAFASPFGISWWLSGHKGYRLAKADDLPLTVLAEQGTPEVGLELAVDIVAENGGSTTLTARIPDADPAASEDLRFQVTVSADAPATPADVTVDGELSIAAGARASTGTVTISAQDNDRYTGDRTVRLAVAETAGRAQVPAALTLTIADDEAAPESSLEFTPERVDEGTATLVAAHLHGAPAGAPVTVTVATTVDDAETAVDFTQSGTVLTIATGASTSSGVLTIATTHDPTDAPDRTLQVSATIAGLPGLPAPPDRTLTIADVDDPPAVQLVPDPPSIAENGGRSRVTAGLSHASAATIVLTVSALPVAPAEAANFMQSGTELTIAARTTQSTGAVTITAVNDDVYRASDLRVELRTAANDAVTTPEPVMLIIEDDDPIPPLAGSVQLVLSPARISEDGGRSEVSVTFSQAQSEAAAVTVTAAPVAPAQDSDFAQNGTELTIAAGATVSTGAVTVSAVNNDVFALAKTVEVTARAATPTGATTVTNSLVIEEDDPRPVVTLELAPSAISENGGAAVVTAAIDPSVSRDTRIRLAVTPVEPARAEHDYTVAGQPLLLIEAGQTSSSRTIGDPYTITASNDILHGGDKSVTVTGALAGDHLAWLRDPEPRTLTITEDDPETPVSGVCGRSDEVRNSILSAIENAEQVRPVCGAVTGAQLAAIGGLSVAGTRATMSPRPGDFAGLPNVRRVSIDSYWSDRSPPVAEYYSLRRLHPRVFAGLSSLRQLDFTRTELVSVPADLLAPLTGLTSLSLHDTRGLVELPSVLLANTPDLQEFSYTGGSLHALPAAFFSGLASLQTIDLSGNLLPSLPAGLFSGRSSLQEIDLSRNTIATLPSRVFAGLPALRSVDVSQSRLAAPFAVLPGGAFEGLSAALQKLALDGVSLEVSLRAAGPGRLRAVVPSGAPFDIVLPLILTNGSVAGGATTVGIAAGAVDSAALAVTRTAGTTAAVTVDIGTLPSLPAGHTGYTLVKKGVPLTVFAEAGAPGVDLVLSPASIPEADGAAMVTARLAAPATEELQLAVAAAALPPRSMRTSRTAATASSPSRRARPTAAVRQRSRRSTTTGTRVIGRWRCRRR